MDSDVTQTSANVLTSTAGSVISSAAEKNGSAPAVDSVPSSSSDANSVDVSARKKSSDDPISSTSDVYAKISSATAMCDPSKSVLLGKTELENEVEDLFVNDCNLSHPRSEKITENVEDIVSDLENLLGNPTDHFSVPVGVKSANDVSDLDDIFFDVDKLDEKKTDRDVSISNRTGNLVDKSVPCESNVSVEDVKAESQNIFKEVDVSPDTNKQDSDENSKESTHQDQSDLTCKLQESDVTSIPPFCKPKTIDIKDENTLNIHPSLELAKTSDEACSTNLNQAATDLITRQDSNYPVKKNADLMEDLTLSSTDKESDIPLQIEQKEALTLKDRISISQSDSKASPVQNLHQDKDSEEGVEISQSDEIYSTNETTTEKNSNEVFTKDDSEMTTENIDLQNVLAESTSGAVIEVPSETEESVKMDTTPVPTKCNVFSEEEIQTIIETTSVSDETKDKLQEVPEDISKTTSVVTVNEEVGDSSKVIINEDLSNTDSEKPPKELKEETSVEESPQAVIIETNENVSKANPDDTLTEDNAEVVIVKDHEDISNDGTSKSYTPIDDSPVIVRTEEVEYISETPINDSSVSVINEAKEETPMEADEEENSKATACPIEIITTEVDEVLESTSKSQEDTTDPDLDTDKTIQNSEVEEKEESKEIVSVLNIVEDTKSNNASDPSVEIVPEIPKDVPCNKLEITEVENKSDVIVPAQEEEDVPCDKPEITEDENKSDAIVSAQIEEACESKIEEIENISSEITDVAEEEIKDHTELESTNVPENKDKLEETADEVDKASEVIPDSIHVEECVKTSENKENIAMDVEETNESIASQSKPDEDITEIQEIVEICSKSDITDNFEKLPETIEDADKGEERHSSNLKVNEEPNQEKSESVEDQMQFEDTHSSDETPPVESSPIEAEPLKNLESEEITKAENASIDVKPSESVEFETITSDKNVAIEIASSEIEKTLESASSEIEESEEKTCVENIPTEVELEPSEIEESKEKPSEENAPIEAEPSEIEDSEEITCVDKPSENDDIFMETPSENEEPEESTCAKKIAIEVDSTKIIESDEMSSVENAPIDVEPSENVKSEEIACVENVTIVVEPPKSEESEEQTCVENAPIVIEPSENKESELKIADDEVCDEERKPSNIEELSPITHEKNDDAKSEASTGIFVIEEMAVEDEEGKESNEECVETQSFVTFPEDAEETKEPKDAGIAIEITAEGSSTSEIIESSTDEEFTRTVGMDVIIEEYSSSSMPETNPNEETMDSKLIEEVETPQKQQTEPLMTSEDNIEEIKEAATDELEKSEEKPENNVSSLDTEVVESKEENDDSQNISENIDISKPEPTQDDEANEMNLKSSYTEQSKESKIDSPVLHQTNSELEDVEGLAQETVVSCEPLENVVTSTKEEEAEDPCKSEVSPALEEAAKEAAHDEDTEGQETTEVSSELVVESIDNAEESSVNEKASSPKKPAEVLDMEVADETEEFSSNLDAAQIESSTLEKEITESLEKDVEEETIIEDTNKPQNSSLLKPIAVEEETKEEKVNDDEIKSDVSLTLEQKDNANATNADNTEVNEIEEVSSVLENEHIDENKDSFTSEEKEDGLKDVEEEIKDLSEVNYVDESNTDADKTKEDEVKMKDDISEPCKTSTLEPEGTEDEDMIETGEIKLHPSTLKKGMDVEKADEPCKSVELLSSEYVESTKVVKDVCVPEETSDLENVMEDAKMVETDDSTKLDSEVNEIEEEEVTSPCKVTEASVQDEDIQDEEETKVEAKELEKANDDDKNELIEASVQDEDIQDEEETKVEAKELEKANDNDKNELIEASVQNEDIQDEVETKVEVKELEKAKDDDKNKQIEEPEQDGKDSVKIEDLNENKVDSPKSETEHAEESTSTENMLDAEELSTEAKVGDQLEKNEDSVTELEETKVDSPALLEDISDTSEPSPTEVTSEIKESEIESPKSTQEEMNKDVASVEDISEAEECNTKSPEMENAEKSPISEQDTTNIEGIEDISETNDDDDASLQEISEDKLTEAISEENLLEKIAIEHPESSSLKDEEEPPKCDSPDNETIVSSEHKIKDDESKESKLDEKSEDNETATEITEMLTTEKAKESSTEIKESISEKSILITENELAKKEEKISEEKPAIEEISEIIEPDQLETPKLTEKALTSAEEKLNVAIDAQPEVSDNQVVEVKKSETEIELNEPIEEMEVESKQIETKSLSETKDISLKTTSKDDVKMDTIENQQPENKEKCTEDIQSETIVDDDATKIEMTEIEDLPVEKVTTKPETTVSVDCKEESKEPKISTLTSQENKEVVSNSEKATSELTMLSPKEIKESEVKDDEQTTDISESKDDKDKTKDLSKISEITQPKKDEKQDELLDTNINKQHIEVDKKEMKLETTEQIVKSSSEKTKDIAPEEISKVNVENITKEVGLSKPIIAMPTKSGSSTPPKESITEDITTSESVADKVESSMVETNKPDAHEVKSVKNTKDQKPSEIVVLREISETNKLSPKSEVKKDVQIPEKVTETVNDKMESKIEKSNILTTETAKAVTKKDSISGEVKEPSLEKTVNKETTSIASKEEEVIKKTEEVKTTISQDKPEEKIKPKTSSDKSEPKTLPDEEVKEELKPIVSSEKTEEVIKPIVPTEKSKKEIKSITPQEEIKSITPKEKSEVQTEKEDKSEVKINTAAQITKPSSEEPKVASNEITKDVVEAKPITNKSVDDKQIEKPDSSTEKEKVESITKESSTEIKKDKSDTGSEDLTKTSEQETEADAKTAGKSVMGRKIEKGKRKYATRKSGSTKEETVTDSQTSEMLNTETQSTTINKTTETTIINSKEVNVSPGKNLEIEKVVDENDDLQQTQGQSKNKSNVILEETKNVDTEKEKLETPIDDLSKTDELPSKRKRGKRISKPSPIAKEKQGVPIDSVDQEKQLIATETVATEGAEKSEEVEKVKRGRPVRKITLKTKPKKKSPPEETQNQPGEINVQLEKPTESSVDKDITSTVSPTETLEVVVTGKKRKRNLRNQRGKVSVSPAAETESVVETALIVKETSVPDKHVDAAAGPKRRRNLRNQMEAEVTDSPTEPSTKTIKLSESPATATESITETPVKETVLPEKPMEPPTGPKRRRNLRNQIETSRESPAKEADEVKDSPSEPAPKRRRRNQPVEADTSIGLETEEVTVEAIEKSAEPVKRRRRNQHEASTEAESVEEGVAEGGEKVVETPPVVKRRRNWKSQPEKPVLDASKPEPESETEKIEKPAESSPVVVKRRRQGRSLPDKAVETITNEAEAVKTEDSVSVIQETIDKPSEPVTVKKRRGWKKGLETSSEADYTPGTGEVTPDKPMEPPVGKKRRGWRKELEANNEAESILKAETDAQKSTPVKAEHSNPISQEATDKPAEPVMKKRRGWKKDLNVSSDTETTIEKKALSKVEHVMALAQEPSDTPVETVVAKKRRGGKKDAEINNEAESVPKTETETQKNTPIKTEISTNQIDQEKTESPVVKKKRGWKKDLEIGNEAESVSSVETDKQKSTTVKVDQSDKLQETVDKPVEAVVGKKRRGWKKELEVSNEAESVSKTEMEVEKSPQVKIEQNEKSAETVPGSKRKRNLKTQPDEAVTPEIESPADQSDTTSVKRRRIVRNQAEKSVESTIGTRRKRSLRNQEAESSVTETEAEVTKNKVNQVDTSQMDDTPEPSIAGQSPASEKNAEDEVVKAARDASSMQHLEPQEAHQVPDCSEVIKAAEDFVKQETSKKEEMMLIQAAQESQNREVEVSKTVTTIREEYKKPLNIVVDNVSVIKEAESTTCEDNEILQKESSSDEDKQAEYSSKISQSQELKLTITKTKTDEPSSILKIYDPKHPSAGVEISPSESETETEELPLPKFVIKQSSPKVMSPLKITIKPVLKPEEQHTQKGSPKLIIKPIVKPDDEIKHPEEKHHSPKITIKPIIKPSDDSERCNSPKITIKPIIKPAEASTSPKIKFKPIAKPEEVKEEVTEEAESREKERIVLKINKNNIPQKEVKKNEDNEKLGKIKVKFSKEGRHAHIVNEEEEREHLNEAEAVKPEPTIDDIPKDLATPKPEVDVEEMPQKIEEVVNSPALSADSPISDMVISIPRKRGRPRKVPLVIREEFKDVKEGDGNVEGSPGGGSEAADPNSGRPKRSCRGPSVTMTLGIKPRKPRGAGRGRIGSRGGGRVEKEPKKGKISESKLKLIKEAAITARVSESLENQDVEMTTVGNPSPIINEDSGEDKSKDSIVEDKLKILSENKSKESGEFKAKEDLGGDKSKEEPAVTKEEAKQEGLVVKEDGLVISDTTVIMYEEETRMSADTNNSRAQTPAKQVLTSNVQDVVEESQSSVQSTATTESAKGKKGSRLDVFREPDGAITSADQLAEYYWGGGGPYMLQEQVAQFLGIKSFKRKYPGIQRRTVDMQERDFIRESSLASENMCDLGLTAVNSADILDIMYSDFQNKYEEYCKHLRDRQTKDITNKQKALSLAASQEKTKLDIMQQAVESAAQWNISFNKSRREERKACMDLQTFTINYPKGSVKQVPKNKIGHYPIALVPGQYTDYYRTFTPTELNNLPLNTMLYHPINVHNDEDSQSDGSGSESDSSSSGSDSSDSDSSDEDCNICSPSATPKKAVL